MKKKKSKADLVESRVSYERAPKKSKPSEKVSLTKPEIPNDLELAEYQTPETVSLEKEGDAVAGYYLGLRPVMYRSGDTGALLLLKQTDGRLIAIPASYDIQRWLYETGFGDKIGEFLMIILDKYVDTGQPSPMKVYRYRYRRGLELSAGGSYTLKQLPAGNKMLPALITDVSEVPAEKWEK